MVKLRYVARFKKFPHLKHPRDLNEKILYLKLFTDTTEWTRLADKYRVREFVKERGLEECLVDLLGVWDNAADIDFGSLPKSFILKTNNGCGKGTNMIVPDKDALNKDAARKIIDTWLHLKHIGALSAEPQYKGIKPCVIAEALLPAEEGQKSLVDYKVWCFNGKASYIMTCTNREKLSTRLNLFDLDWNPVPQYLKPSSYYPVETETIDKPLNLDRMIEVAEKLSSGFPCVRVDLYNLKGKVYFGEMTFTSLGGMMDYYTPEFLMKCGEMIDLRDKA
ncbi:MAG: hypothetical protein K6A41_05810 [Bacteroidales bacterium]|nr:hypothetical protein [Bacteroidales bacterium]